MKMTDHFRPSAF